MKILLIGNFAPPYEEENLYNISLLNKLQEDGHTCTVLNTSDNPSHNQKFIDSGNYIDFVFKLLRHCVRKNVVHFSTKGYLRLGLLKLMTSILIGKIMGAKTFITIHSELFAIAGQMRSPVGGRQTLFTSFTVADKIICADKDTFEVAAMYMKKTNFELIPSFLYTPPDIIKRSELLNKLEGKERVIVFANVLYPSLVFEILKELISNFPFPDNTGFVIAISEKPESHLRHLIEDIGSKKSDNIFFIAPDDLISNLAAYSRANIILRPMSCDGMTFFEDFAISVKKLSRSEDYIYFPTGLLFIKEGSAAELCLCILNTMLCVEAGPSPEISAEIPYEKIRMLYDK